MKLLEFPRKSHPHTDLEPPDLALVRYALVRREMDHLAAVQANIRETQRLRVAVEALTARLAGRSPSEELASCT